MSSRMKTVLLVVLTFVLGLGAGLGLGAAYGRNTADAALQQKVAELESQYKTANDNYMVVVREYNKLFGLKTVAAVPVAAAAAAAPVAAPAVKATAAPAASEAPKAEATPEAAAATPESAATEESAPSDSASGSGSGGGAAPVAEFLGTADGGTGPQEGPPPLTVKFTDMSTGEITSWEWTFGDGETSTEQNPEHIFEACPAPDELCTVKLKVCGPGGCAETVKDEYIFVSETCTGC